MTKNIQGVPEGNVVVTWDQDRTRILAVTRQDDDGRILSVIAEIPAPTEGDAEALALADWIEGEACGGSNWSAKAKRTAEVLRALASKAQPKGGDKANEWRKLAQQFDGQRMAAMAHLRTLLAFPDTHAEAVRAFLAATPAEQIASVALAQAPAPAQPNDTVFYVHQSDLDEVLRFGTAVDCVLGSKPLAGTPPRADYVKAARVYALAYGLHDDAPSYLPRTQADADVFEPHAWVIGAMMQAFGDGWADGHAAGIAFMKEAAKRQAPAPAPEVDSDEKWEADVECITDESGTDYSVSIRGPGLRNPDYSDVWMKKRPAEQLVKWLNTSVLARFNVKGAAVVPKGT